MHNFNANHNKSIVQEHLPSRPASQPVLSRHYTSDPSIQSARTVGRTYLGQEETTGGRQCWCLHPCSRKANLAFKPRANRLAKLCADANFYNVEPLSLNRAGFGLSYFLVVEGLTQTRPSDSVELPKSSYGILEPSRSIHD